MPDAPPAHELLKGKIVLITAAAGVIAPPTCGFGPSNIGQSATSPVRRAGPVGMSPSPPAVGQPDWPAGT